MIAICLIIMLATRAEAAAPTQTSWNDPQRSQSRPIISTTSTTTTIEPPIIEDSLNSATSESSNDQEDTICFKCYDQVTMTKSLIGIQLDLKKRISDLIKRLEKSSTTKPDIMGPRRNKQPRQVPRNFESQESNPSQNRPNLDQGHQHLSTRTWTNLDSDKPRTVVSVLRVSRSTDNLNPTGNPPARKNRIPALKHLEGKKQQQLNETCKSLNELLYCLNGIKNDCVGNFHYHSHEMFTNQWYDKLHCNHNKFGFLTRSVIEEDKKPVARPISTPEETQAKLDAIFGSMNIGRMGVMLKPELTRSATQKFDAMGQQEQQFDKTGSYQGSHFKGRQYFGSNDISNPSKGFLSKSQSASYVTSQLLLIPGFLVLCLAIVAVTMAHYFKQIQLKLSQKNVGRAGG